ncbi:MAG: nicotinate phosphoribosyltransferase [Chloroflexota bacterium]
MAGTNKNRPPQYRCSFCSRSQEQVSRMIGGPNGVFICNECVGLCQDIVDEDATSPAEVGTGSGWTLSASKPAPPVQGEKFPFLPQVISGEAADVYFLRTAKVLDDLGLDPVVGFQIFPRVGGTFCGLRQVEQLLGEAHFTGELWSLPDGSGMRGREPAMRIVAPYSKFGIYETAILGILASCSGWATAAREVIEAAAETPVISFGARHIHPNVSAFMEYASIVAGFQTGATPLGAALAGKEPSGTMSHAFILIVGDSVKAAEAFNRVMPPDVPRIVLVDTFQDPAVESVRVAEALGPALRGVRLDTAGERGGVTAALIREVRARLDQAGFPEVQIVVSGGITPDRIRAFRAAKAPVNAYGVGSYVTAASPIDFTGDIREIDGKPIAKLGRIPGLEENPRLRRVL